VLVVGVTEAQEAIADYHGLLENVQRDNLRMPSGNRRALHGHSRRAAALVVMFFCASRDVVSFAVSMAKWKSPLVAEKSPHPRGVV